MLAESAVQLIFFSIFATMGLYFCFHFLGCSLECLDSCTEGTEGTEGTEPTHRAEQISVPISWLYSLSNNSNTEAEDYGNNENPAEEIENTSHLVI